MSDSMQVLVAVKGGVAICLPKFQTRMIRVLDAVGGDAIDELFCTDEHREAEEALYEFFDRPQNEDMPIPRRMYRYLFRLNMGSQDRDSRYGKSHGCGPADEKGQPMDSWKWGRGRVKRDRQYNPKNGRSFEAVTPSDSEIRMIEEWRQMCEVRDEQIREETCWWNDEFDALNKRADEIVFTEQVERLHHQWGVLQDLVARIDFETFDQDIRPLRRLDQELYELVGNYAVLVDRWYTTDREFEIDFDAFLQMRLAQQRVQRLREWVQKDQDMKSQDWYWMPDWYDMIRMEMERDAEIAEFQQRDLMRLKLEYDEEVLDRLFPDWPHIRAQWEVDEREQMSLALYEQEIVWSPRMAVYEFSPIRPLARIWGRDWNDGEKRARQPIESWKWRRASQYKRNGRHNVHGLSEPEWFNLIPVEIDSQDDERVRDADRESEEEELIYQEVLDKALVCIERLPKQDGDVWNQAFLNDWAELIELMEFDDEYCPEDDFFGDVIDADSYDGQLDWLDDPAEQLADAV